MTNSQRASGWFFRVPRQQEEPASSAATASADQPSTMLSDDLVLLIFDSAFIRRTCSALLRRRGFGTIEAENREEAMKLYQENYPNVVLMDLRLADGEHLRTLRSLVLIDPDARVVMVTDGSKEVVDEALQAGARGFILKPFSGEHIVDAVNSALSGADPELFSVHGWSRLSHTEYVPAQ